MEYKIEFTEKEITTWSGILLLIKMLDKMQLGKCLSSLDLPMQGSNRGYNPIQLIKQFMTSIWCGANRFGHTEVTRQDEVIRQFWGFERMAGHKAIQRFFKKFDLSINQRVFTGLYQWFFSNLKFDNFTLDVDSSVCTRYGIQEGAKKVYNRKKPGRLSHHPLMAFIADCKMVANFWLRWGDAFTSNNIEAFLGHLSSKLLRLFKEEGIYKEYRYSCLVTDLDLPAEIIWRSYRMRADAENRIKELNYDFGANSFNLHNFSATEAALNFVMIAYNIISLFRQVIIKTTINERLKTLKYRVFAIGGYLVKNRNQCILKLSFAMKRREWFTGLWLNTNNLKSPPTFVF